MHRHRQKFYASSPKDRIFAMRPLQLRGITATRVRMHNHADGHIDRFTSSIRLSKGQYIAVNCFHGMAMTITQFFPHYIELRNSNGAVSQAHLEKFAIFGLEMLNSKRPLIVIVPR